MEQGKGQRHCGTCNERKMKCHVVACADLSAQMDAVDQDIKRQENGGTAKRELVYVYSRVNGRERVRGTLWGAAAKGVI